MSKIVDLVSLASIVPPLNHEISGGFSAMVDGKQVRVRAVLERTVVIEHQEGGERSVAATSHGHSMRSGKLGCCRTCFGSFLFPRHKKAA